MRERKQQEKGAFEVWFLAGEVMLILCQLAQLTDAPNKTLMKRS
jgi:hypothetical protein